MSNIETKLTEISVSIGVLNEKVDKLTDSLERMDHAIHGNGSEGLKITVAKLEESESRRVRREWLFAGALISLTVTILGIIIRWVIAAG